MLRVFKLAFNQRSKMETLFRNISTSNLDNFLSSYGSAFPYYNIIMKMTLIRISKLLLLDMTRRMFRLHWMEIILQFLAEKKIIRITFTKE